MDHFIDAHNKILGRIASQAALFLRGKDSPAFDPSRVSLNRVTVINTDLMRITGKKMLAKIYYRHSGYPGGLREERLGDLMRRDSREVLRRAVMGMLPKNRLRAKMIKHLILFKEHQK